jgi:methionyl aminopeptidase
MSPQKPFPVFSNAEISKTRSTVCEIANLLKPSRSCSGPAWNAVHQVAARLVRPGISTLEIDAAVELFILEHQAEPLFKGVPGIVPFPATMCISIDEEVVHGIPDRRTLHEGDIVSIDIGCRWQGWCGDAAMTHPVGKISPDRERLLSVTEETLRLALRLMHPGVRWSAIAHQMDRFVRQAGFTTIADQVGGHGIGRDLWEPPSVPNASSPQFERHGDFTLEAGMVLAVEPMVSAGSVRVHVTPDHWTLVTADGSPSAHFEHTIALTEQGTFVLTAGPQGQGWSLPA